MVIWLPVFGFLPLRDFLSERSKVPNPTNLTSSPLDTLFCIISKAVSRISSVCVFEKLVVFAIFSTN